MLTYMEKSDQQLAVDALRGDERAMTELVDRYLKPVYAFVYRLTGSAEDAQDIAQETFVKVWKNLKKFRPDASFKTWVLAIARNTAIDWLRKKKNPVFSEFTQDDGYNVLTETLADPAPLPDELVARMQEKHLLDGLLGALPAGDREILLLHYNDHLTFADIGTMIKRPLNTVKSRHRRALIALRKMLDAPT